MERKTILTFCFILLSFWLNAQKTDSLLNLPLDTAVSTFETIEDTVVVNTEEDESYDAEDEEEEDEEGYFLKNETTVNWRDSFTLRKLPDSLLQVLQGDEDFWYANTIFKKKEKGKKQSPQNSNQNLSDLSWLNPIIWFVIIVAFIAFLILLLANSNIRLFRRSSTISKGQQEEEAATDDIFGINYQKEIDKSINTGNFRLAVRFMFLRLLRDLSEKKVIQYTQDRTNFDYLLQIHNTGLYAGFFRIVRNYEYAWYGHFEVDKEKFNVIRSDFEGFDKQINRS